MHIQIARAKDEILHGICVNMGNLPTFSQFLKLAARCQRTMQQTTGNQHPTNLRIQKLKNNIILKIFWATWLPFVMQLFDFCKAIVLLMFKIVHLSISQAI